MQVSITGHHVELTDALKDLVHHKLQHLKHSFDHVLDVHVVLSVEKNRQRCEINIQANGVNIHGHDENDDMYASVDGVIAKLNRQLKRYRSKLQSHGKKGSRKGRAIQVAQFDLAHDVEEFSEDHSHQAMKHEHVHADIMSVDEAIMQMELSEKQSVLIFTNDVTEKINVISRQVNGSLNWVELDN